MAFFTVKIDPASATIALGGKSKFKAVVDGLGSNPVVSYKWESSLGTSTSDTIELTGKNAGASDLKLTVTAKDDTNTTEETDSAVSKVTVSKGTMTVTSGVDVNKSEGSVGDEFTATASASGQPDGATVSYKWDTGETTPSVTKKINVEGKYTFKCEITVKHEDYTDVKVSRSKSVNVKANDKDIEYFIHSLPHIDAAFMYGSWWALDEIQRLTEEGKDWKTETGMLYEDEIKGFKKILADYNIVMVQESRNGRIIDRQKLESGLIY